MTALSRHLLATALATTVCILGVPAAAIAGPPGSLVGNFGRSGVTVVSGGMPDFFPIDVATDSRGEIYVLGRTEFGPTWQFPDSSGDDQFCSSVGARARAWTVTRFTSRGVPDKAFGDAGTLVVHFPRDATTVHFHMPTSISLQPDGKLIVAGLIDTIKHNTSKATRGKNSSTTGRRSDSDCTWDPLIDNNRVTGAVRFTRGGRVDRTFGDHGTALLPKAGIDIALTALDSRGRLYVVDRYKAKRQDEIFRLKSDGTLDKSFASKGSLDYPNYVNSAIVDSHDRLILGGNAAIARITTRGRLDTMYAGSASLAASLRFVSELTPVGSGLAAIGSSADDQARILRLDAAGRPVNSFGVNGAIDLGAGFGNSIYATANGSLVADWSSLATAGGYPWRLSRVDASGMPDPNFHGELLDMIAQESWLNDEAPFTGPPFLARPLNDNILLAGYGGPTPGQAGRRRLLVLVQG